MRSKRLVHPLLLVELAPGQAVWMALHMPHPLGVEAVLPLEEDKTSRDLVRNSTQVAKDRSETAAIWQAKARSLVAETVKESNPIQDPPLRHLLCGNRLRLTEQEPLGSFCHIARWRAIAAECSSGDAKYVDEIVHGLPIIGQVEPSGRWPSLKRSPAISVAEIIRKAWALREKSAGSSGKGV